MRSPGSTAASASFRSSPSRRAPRVLLLALVLPLAAAARVPAESYRLPGGDRLTYRPRILWAAGELELEIEHASPDRLSPKTRYESERVIERHLTDIFLEAVSGLRIDSDTTVGESMTADPRILRRLEETAAVRRKKSSVFTPDLEAVSVRYGFPLFGPDGIAEPYIRHLRAYPIRRTLRFVPTTRFSGVVIYARGTYPAFGKDGEEPVRPALFPRIFDESMQVVIEKDRCDPEALRSRGMVAYTDSLDIDEFAPRIGSFPLRILARRVFGVGGTDIVIPDLDAGRLLALPENRELLATGRILIVVDDVDP